MRPVQFTALVLWLFTPFAVLANCDARNEVSTHFSDPLKQDKFSVVINGADCAGLTQTIRIHNAENELLYIHSSAFIDGTRAQISKQFIEFIMQFTLHQNFFDLTNNLPSWEELKRYDDESEQMLLVSHAEYIEFKNQRWPLFSHQSSKDKFLTLAYDRTNKKIVKIINGNSKW